MTASAADSQAHAEGPCKERSSVHQRGRRTMQSHRPEPLMASTSSYRALAPFDWCVDSRGEAVLVGFHLPPNKPLKLTVACGACSLAAWR
jgi:hypothetical protein